MIFKSGIKIKQAYYYFFYRLYLSMEIPPFAGGSDWKAALLMAILEIWVFFSGFMYYQVFFNKNAMLAANTPLLLIFTAIVTNSKYLAFFYNNAWMHYFERFENWSSEKNKKGGRIVLIVTAVIIINFALAIFFHQIDWFA